MNLNKIMRYLFIPILFCEMNYFVSKMHFKNTLNATVLLENFVAPKTH